MNILSKIKELFTKKKLQAIPEHATSASSISDDSTIVGTIFMRDDGTQIMIRPELDKLGNQLYEQVFNSRTNHFQAIPKYSIKCDELSKIYGPQILSESILLDVDANLLSNPNYSDYIANNLLNAERIGKIFNEYCSYAGGVSLDASGRICGKYVDDGIIQTLSADKEQRQKIMEAERARREELSILAAREAVQNIQVNYKDSHAQVLSK